jgi:hypothetical protein
VSAFDGSRIAYRVLPCPVLQFAAMEGALPTRPEGSVGSNGAQTLPYAYLLDPYTRIKLSRSAILYPRSVTVNSGQDAKRRPHPINHDFSIRHGGRGHSLDSRTVHFITASLLYFVIDKSLRARKRLNPIRALQSDTRVPAAIASPRHTC